MKNYLKIIAAMFVWSTWGVMIRWIGLPPVVVLFHTSLVAAVLVPLVLKIRGEFPADVFSFHSWHLFAALALASILNNITYFYSLGNTTVSNAVFTHYTAPVFVAVLAPLLINERLQRITVVSLPIAAVGMGFIVMKGGGLNLNGEHLSGIAAGTASGIAYALLIIFSRKLSRMLLHQKAVIVLLWITVLATAPVALSMDYHLNLRAGVLLLATGIFHSTTAPLMYFSALKEVLAQHAAVLGYIEPLAAIPLAFLFLSEIPPMAALVGGFLILISGYMIIHSRLKASV
jgi:drug/metabolite transporter (DMT)-like permease